MSTARRSARPFSPSPQVPCPKVGWVWRQPARLRAYGRTHSFPLQNRALGKLPRLNRQPTLGGRVMPNFPKRSERLPYGVRLRTSGATAFDVLLCSRIPGWFEGGSQWTFRQSVSTRAPGDVRKR